MLPIKNSGALMREPLLSALPISETKAHVSPVHLKEISGFAHRQPNLDFANKARLLPPSPLCLTDSDICMLFEEASVLIRKPKLGEKKGGLRRLATGGTELVGN